MSEFVWRKKIKTSSSNSNSNNQLEREQELSRLQQERLDRELHRKKRHEQQTLQLRISDQSQSAYHKQQEDQFHLEQLIQRCAARYKDNRQQTVDVLLRSIYIAQYSQLFEIVTFSECVDAVQQLKRLSTVEELTALKTEIGMISSLEWRPLFKQNWSDLLIVLEDLLKKIRLTKDRNDVKRAYSDLKFHQMTWPAYDPSTLQKVHSAVMTDIHKTLLSKSLEQLLQLKQDVEQRLLNYDTADDDYWRTMSLCLDILIARQNVCSRHLANMQAFIVHLQSVGRAKQASGWKQMLGQEVEESPQLADDLDHELVQQVNSTQEPQLVSKTSDFRWYQDEIRNYEAEKVELDINMELAQEELVKEYMPRELCASSIQQKKPRYHNSKILGFEWNAYNRAHYTKESPPSKVVLGYKFNIYYPDLVQVKPRYRVIADPESKQTIVNSTNSTVNETALLVFSAGDQYDDVQFKILNREWEFSARRGFRCTFERGVMSLWFRLKKKQVNI